MLPAPLWLAFVRAMLVVDDGTRITQLSQWGKAKRRRLRRKKGSQPRLAALGSPFQGKGLAWTFPPSIGRRCPEGAEVGWGKRYEKRSGKIVSSTPLTKAPERRWRGPPSPMGNAIKLSKILIAHVGNSVCFFHAFFLKVNNKTKN